MMSGNPQPLKKIRNDHIQRTNMGAFRPQMHIMDIRGRVKVLTYPTYAKLKADIPNKIGTDHDPDGLFVVRAKYDGGWRSYCEWYERWETDGVNPKTGDYKVKIKKQGWS